MEDTGSKMQDKFETAVAQGDAVNAASSINVSEMDKDGSSSPSKASSTENENKRVDKVDKTKAKVKSPSKTLKPSERSRSRSKSPRAGAKTEGNTTPHPENKNEKVQSKEKSTKPKKGQKRKSDEEKSVPEGTSNSMQCDDKETKTKKSVKKDKKSKTSKVEVGTESVSEKKTEIEQNSRESEKDSNVEMKLTTPKPKRKYVRKTPFVKRKEPSESTSGDNNNLPKQEATKEGLALVNGDASTNEVPEKIRKKPGPKKGSKRKVPSKNLSPSKPAGSSEGAPVEATDKRLPCKPPECESDADTMDHTSTPTKASQVQEMVSANNKKVVKIDDIEITELSDLNSSRDESNDENEREGNVEAVTGQSIHQTDPVIDPPTFISLSECEQEDKSYKCSYPNCKYTGKARVLLRKHLTCHHIYLCAHCEYHCNVATELDTHMTAMHPQRWGRKKCKKCQKYIQGNEFSSHEESCDGSTQFACDQCGKVFRFVSKLEDHIRKLHANIKCEHCEFIAENKLSMRKHMASMHRSKKSETAKEKSSPHSKATATSVSGQQLDSHPDDKSSPQLANDISEHETSEMSDTSPNKLVTNSIPTVEKSVEETDSVSSVNHSKVDKVEDSQQDIEISSNSFSNPNFLKNRLSECSNEEDLETTDKSDSAHEQTVAKVQAESSLDTKDMDTNSLSSFTSITALPFVSCNMRVVADSSGQVTLSIPDIPVNAPLMSPDSTTSFFPSIKSSTVEPVNCDVDGCGLEFKNSRLLNIHKKSVHNILPSEITYPCDHPGCPLRFKKKGQLKKHMVVHTGERKYLCTFEGCDKAFRHNANLKIHNLLHTGEKPIKCKFCEFACRQKSSLIHHMKTKHKEIGWPIKIEDLPKFDESLTNEGDTHEKETANKEVETEMAEAAPNESTDLNESNSSSNNEIEEKVNDHTPLVQTPDKKNTIPTQESTPLAPKVLSTPTKAMVKAMAPGFLLAAGAMSDQSGEPLRSPLQTQNSKSDVYEFDDEDEDANEMNKVEALTHKSTVKKSPKSKAPCSTTSVEEATPAKKKRGPRKKKEGPSVLATKPQSPKGKKTSPKKKKSQQENEVAGMEELARETVAMMDQMDEVSKPVEESETAPIEPEIEPESDSMVEEHVSENMPPLSSISSDYAAAYGSEHEPSVEQETESAAPPPDFDDNMGPPPAPAPAYNHLEHSPLSAMDVLDEEGLSSSLMAPVDNNELPTDTLVDSPQIDPQMTGDQTSAERCRSPFSEISPVSQVHSNDNRGVPSVNSMQSPLKEPHSTGTPQDMHVPMHREHNSFDIDDDVLSPHKKMGSAFDDMDPDEAAKILEESDEREKLRNERERLRGVRNDFNAVLQEVKDSFKYHSSPTRHDKDFPDSLHLPPGPVPGETSASYDFASFGRQHSDYSHIQGIDNQNKDSESVSGYSDMPQRRPSSSYVQDFLPPSLGNANAGPPSVSSSYSTHSNSVQNQNDLSSYGASSVAAGLSAYQPSVSLPSYMSTASYPTTTAPTSFSDAFAQRSSTVRDDLYRSADSHTPSATTSTSSYTSSYPSRDLFRHPYFQDPALPLPGSQQDPRALSYPAQQSSLQALQRSSADFLQRASATALPGMNYPSVTESLARLSQTSGQQSYFGHDDRSRSWAQASPIIMPQEIDSAGSLNRNPFSASRSDLSGLDPTSKRNDPPFPGVSQTIPGASDCYDVASAYMGTGHFNPAAAPSNYSKSLSSMNDYRTLSHPGPSMTDMYCMGIYPPLGPLDKNYPYSRATEAMYRSQQLGSNPLMAGTQSAYGERDYVRHPYAQASPYGKYLPCSNLGQPLPPVLQGAGDYFPPRPGAPDPYMHDPYRRSVIHNMMTRYF